MDKYIGKRLDGRYVIKDIIGVGGMACVYRAYDSVDDRVVAVKILKEEFDESISPIELDEYAGIMDFVFGRPKRQSIFPEEYFKEEGSEE